MVSEYLIAFLTILALSLASGFCCGGAPERWGAAVLLIQFVLQVAVNQIIPQRYDELDLTSVAFDLFAMAGFGYLAIYSQRFWPIWATSFQVLSLTSHFAAVEQNLPGMVYGIMKSGPTTAACLTILFGTVLHRRRLRLRGFDPDWKDW